MENKFKLALTDFKEVLPNLIFKINTEFQSLGCFGIWKGKYLFSQALTSKFWTEKDLTMQLTFCIHIWGEYTHSFSVQRYAFHILSAM